MSAYDDKWIRERAAKARRQAALEFIDYIAKSGAASEVTIEQFKLAARLWAYEQGAPDDLPALLAANARILETIQDTSAL